MNGLEMHMDWGNCPYSWSCPNHIKVGCYCRNAWHKEVSCVSTVLEVVEMYNNMVEEEKGVVEVVTCRSIEVVVVSYKSTSVVVVNCRNMLVEAVSCKSTLVVVVTCTNT
ncbi:hypothetical protein ACJIZ3_008194 [Penstemon smallii]|uniref:Uncharacterized protein n=1 Tax=Penstemon smallii TaxID=265156 RepID=A0ABD3TAL3_9LAMI